MDGQLQNVTRPFPRKGPDHRVLFGHRFAVDGGNKIAAHSQARIAHPYLIVRRTQPGIFRGRSARHRLDQQPAVRRKMQRLGQISRDEYRLHAQPRRTKTLSALKSASMFFARLIGLANPIPTFPPPGP